MAKDIDAIKEVFHTGEYVAFTLDSVLLSWAKHLATPDTAFDSVGKFKVTATLDEDMAKEMTEVGFNIKKKKDAEGEEHYEIVPTRKPELGAPTVVDTEGNVVDPNTIGNGSIATLHVKAKSMEIMGRVHLPVYIEKVVIEDLVTYGGGGDSYSPFS